MSQPLILKDPNLKATLLASLGETSLIFQFCIFINLQNTKYNADVIIFSRSHIMKQLPSRLVFQCNVFKKSLVLSKSH